MHRSSLSVSERRFRSRLTQLIQQHGLLRGSLSLRSRPCGKPTCRCASGQLHTSLYLVQSQQGQPRQLYIPPDWEDRVRQAVSNYQELQRLLEELSQLEWQRLQQRRKE
jgi:hypothetical protein